MIYLRGLTDRLELKKEFPDMVLQSDQGNVYASKDFNELLPMYNALRVGGMPRSLLTQSPPQAARP